MEELSEKENIPIKVQFLIEKIKEELYSMSSQNNLQQFEIKKKQMEMLLSRLENNLKIDIFAEEFIIKEGIDTLITIIQMKYGNIRMHALESTTITIF